MGAITYTCVWLGYCQRFKVQSIHFCMETDRKNRTVWTDQGLRALEAHGHNALKAQPLAHALGVSRGSFYWHFEDLSDFHSALLVRWRERMFDQIVQDVTRPGHNPIRRLLERVLSEPSRLEIAVRSWALVNSQAAQMVEDVDKRRVDFIKDLLCKAGCPPELAVTRAQLFNWAYLGFALSNRRLDPETRNNIVEDLMRFGNNK
jgi:AcrR family transcriptional regulator